MTAMAVISLALSAFVGWQYVGLIDCLRDRATADEVRTKAIADATDRERAADLALLTGVRPGGPTVHELREADVAARRHTDEVRRLNPAPAAGAANCG
jgi:hypothetical protein